MEKMARMTRPRLTSVEPLPDYRLRLTFVNGSVHTVDFKPLFAESPGLAPLRAPDTFASAVVDQWGWSVEWPERDIQIGADTLWLDAQAQNAADENTRLFCQWRARHGLSIAQAAQALGMTPRTMSAYGTGTHPVPRYIVLACKGWEAEHGGH
jgi:hypothetical protein